MREVMEINGVEFETVVIQEKIPVLVDFWAPWCGPCKMIAPVLSELAADNRDRLKVVKVNVDENPDLAARFDVMGIPTMILFKGGKVVDSFTGSMAKQELAAKIDPYL